MVALTTSHLHEKAATLSSDLVEREQVKNHFVLGTGNY
jgi:hypothetical protein